MISVLYMGQKPLGERLFNTVLGNSEAFRLAFAVSNEIGEETWWKSNNIYITCRERGIPFISNARRYTERILELMDSAKPDILISVQHAWILPAAVLEKVGGRAYNLHCAPLPEYKGYNSFSHAILNGDDSYGVTIHEMAEKVDEGDIILDKRFAINGGETSWSLYNKTCEAGVEIFGEFLRLLAKGAPLPRRSMQGDGKFYGRNSLDGLKLINDAADAREVDLKSRAFYFPPFEPAFFIADGKKHHVLPPNS